MRPMKASTHTSGVNKAAVSQIFPWMRDDPDTPLSGKQCSAEIGSVLTFVVFKVFL